MAGSPSGALGATFKITRMLQAISLITIIGMTANFIAEMVADEWTAPKVLIAVISITSVAILYCVLTYILFIDQTLPFLANTAVDGLLTIALVVLAVVVGKPLSFLDCQALGDAADKGSSAYAFVAELESDLEKYDGKIRFDDWIGTSKTVCLEMKSIWGLDIALCILFAFSAICSICLWRQGRSPPAKDVA